MNKEEVKAALLTGIIGGITAAITLVVLAFGYIEIKSWYMQHKHRQKIEKLIEGSSSDSIQYIDPWGYKNSKDTIE